MPKKTLGFCGVILVTSTHAVTICEPGYYLENGACQDCGAGYYCHDNTRYSCFDIDKTAVWAYSVVNGNWNDVHASERSHCKCTWEFTDATRTKYEQQDICDLGPGGDQYTLYNWCRAGFFASAPLGWGDWYTACEPCTNGPAHSHYTSYSTPSEMYAVESNCPWECDDGYGRVGDMCEPLCTAGVTHLRAGDATAPLFPVRRTTPSLVVQMAGGVCYGNLTVGQGTGINVHLDGTTYHLGN